MVLFNLVLLFSALSFGIPSNFQEIQYGSQGSCEKNNLLFNAARFTKIDLNRKSEHDLPMYLQVILFLNENQPKKKNSENLKPKKFSKIYFSKLNN